jgi:hypothetical protein
MTRLWTPLVLCLPLLLSCSEEKKCQPRVVETEETCSTTDDCVAAGYFGLGCVNGTCSRACNRDEDCAVVAKITDDDEERCPELAEQKALTFVCEEQLCRSGCPDVACAEGETCSAGRCAIFAETWEPKNGTDTVTPEILGWNADDRELENVKTKIVFEGLTGCPRGDEKCAGPAADGKRFVAIERVPTPAQSTPTQTDTCRACACCLECKLAPPAMNLELAQCPRNVDIPAEAMCPAQVPAVCATVCTACDGCTAAPATREIGAELKTCEREAAAKTCPACEMPCQTGQPCPPAECTQCRDAVRCDLDKPGSSDCIMLHDACDAQGANGCFGTPVARPRSQLTDKEQSLLSPAIALGGLAGELVLELQYVPFDVGEQYRVVQQGVDPSMWAVAPQEVVLEMCGGNCNAEASWMSVTTVSGAMATFPRASERRNGVRLGAQSIIDWRSNRVLIPIPEALRTGEFRFRLVPRLADNVRFGVDKISIRRRAP